MGSLTRFLVLSVALLGGCQPLIDSAPVHVWQDDFTLPMYAEGPPNANPSFDFFQPARINYPYTIRDNLTNERVDGSRRALFLENEYLRCTVLPDIGGHLYSCTDKINGEEVFYANPSIKLTKIGYRGAWAAFGIEFNFPVSHNWMSTSPVDFAYQENADGSGSVWVGNIDRVFGTHWLVELKLRPGRAVLEQHTTLYNRSDFRHRFYWWTNAAVQVWDDSRILYPQTHTASHGFSDIDTWPVDSRGTDNSVVGNHVYGPVSRFSHGSREPYMAVYHARTDAGVVHYSSPVDLPAKKVWSFGGDDRGLAWREALSDNGSAYVEIQAGVFRNQETYGFLEPQQRLSFSEYWLPIRELGGVSRATREAVVHMERTESELTVSLNVSERRAGARVRLSQEGDVIRDQAASLEPAELYRLAVPLSQLPDLGAGVTIQVMDSVGGLLLEHTEGEYDLDDSLQVGPVEGFEFPGPAARTEGEWLTWGDDRERNGRRLEARSTYEAGLTRFPGSLLLARALGRLDVSLKRYASAAERLGLATSRVSNDLESWYYLGHARLALGDPDGARAAWEKSQAFGLHRAASLFHLAAVASTQGNHAAAVELLAEANHEAPSSRAMVMHAALLRGRGDAAGAHEWVERARFLDPTSSHARFEAVRQGGEDAALWSHLAGDPERIIEVAVDYGRFGLWEDAVSILSRDYAMGAPVFAEPGQPRPGDYPLVHYYRAFYEAKLGEDPESSLAAARQAPLDYVFPNRHETIPVLNHALAADSLDSSARFLRGAVALSGGMAEAAMLDWERVLESGARVPSLHYVMGKTVVAAGGDQARAAELFEAGVKVEPENEGLYFALDDVLEGLGRSAGERAAALFRFPDPTAMTPDLVYSTARRLVEAGRFDDAEFLFDGRFFASEEGGVNPREVWLEVRLGRAAAAARAGRCDLAGAVTRDLTDATPGMSFTEEGLPEWLERRADLAAERDRIRSLCPSS